MPPNPTTKSWSAWFDVVLYHAEFYLLFEDFAQEELDRGRNTASNSLLRLEEMYQDERLVKKLGAQLKFLKTCQGTNFHGLPELFLGANATCHSGTCKNGELVAVPS